MEENMAKKYHHGIVIREAREAIGMTQEELAACWHADGRIVSPRYVKAVEAGDRIIADCEQLRYLSRILRIPPWRFGLSEYNPFTQQFEATEGDTSLFDVSLDLAEQIITRISRSRRAVPLPQTEEALSGVDKLFAYYRQLPTAQLQDKRFLRLFTYYEQLKGMLYKEHRQYNRALQTFHSMHTTALQLGEPGPIAVALVAIGAELDRMGRHEEAIDALELARDESFAASKPVMAYAHAYLARAYSSSGDALHFERSIYAARNIADAYKHYGDGLENVYHPPSGILAELSYGYIEVGEPQKTLAMRPEIERQIEKEGNTWLHAWIPWDWARAHQALGEIEASVNEGREFFKRGLLLQSPHVLGRSFQFVRDLEAAGYGDIPIVREFHGELIETMRFLQGELREAATEALEKKTE
jgi:tetratricopeptide (TPR) repeat protein